MDIQTLDNGGTPSASDHEMDGKTLFQRCILKTLLLFERLEIVKYDKVSVDKTRLKF